MYTAEYFIESLRMEPHIEGGYFKECLLGADTLQDYGGTDGHDYDGESRHLWSSIYFLLREEEVSHFHRLTYDEVWYYHAGNALTIYVIDEVGVLHAKKLGLNAQAGEQPQIVVPAGCIFGSAMEEEGFSLVGCMCSPAFRYEEFELFSRRDLLAKYPQYEDVIVRLTREE